MVQTKRCTSHVRARCIKTDNVILSSNSSNLLHVNKIFLNVKYQQVLHPHLRTGLTSLFGRLLFISGQIWTLPPPPPPPQKNLIVNGFFLFKIIYLTHKGCSYLLQGPSHQLVCVALQEWTSHLGPGLPDQQLPVYEQYFIMKIDGLKLGKQFTHVKKIQIRCTCYFCNFGKKY